MYDDQGTCAHQLDLCDQFEHVIFIDAVYDTQQGEEPAVPLSYGGRLHLPRREYELLLIPRRYVPYSAQWGQHYTSCLIGM